jgi:dihydrofolate reductase
MGTDRTLAGIARQCIERALLDEIVVHLVPVLLGEGVRFYDDHRPALPRGEAVTAAMSFRPAGGLIS